MQYLCRCQALMAMLIAGLFAFSHAHTARPRVLVTERPRRVPMVALGRPPAWGRS